jgi:hypothetical protein
MPVKTEIDVSGWDDFGIQSQELDEALCWKDLSVSYYECPPVEFFTRAQDCDQVDCGEFLSGLSTPPKYQIRNHDCMWSGTCVDKSHPGKLKLLENAAALQQTLNTTPATTTQCTDIKIKEENESNNNSSNNSNQNISKTTSSSSNIQVNTQKVKLQQIQPGRSLLINSRLNNNNNSSNKNFNVKSAAPQQPAMSELLKFENNTLLTTPSSMSTTGGAGSTRPDTPLNLDDDPPEFKHNFDLATCTSGSNNMSLVTPEDAKYINLLKEHLEESTQEIICSKQQNDLKLLQQPSSIATTPLTPNQPNVYSESLTDLLSYLKYLPDYLEVDEEDSAVEMDSSDSEASSSNGGRSINSGMSSTSSGILSSQSSTYDYQATHVGDHSYTRPKKCYDLAGLGVQTPSDSGEFLKLNCIFFMMKKFPRNYVQNRNFLPNI